MYHSVYFGNKNSYTDWHLVPDGAPVIALPEQKTTMIEVPGSTGFLDLSESLTNYPLFKKRSGSIKFHVLNDYGQGTHANRTERYTDISSYLHGKSLYMKLEDDPDWVYNGRFNLKWTMNNDGMWSDVEISYILQPFKYYTGSLSSMTPLVETTASKTSTSSSSTLVLPANKKTFPTIAQVSITSNTTTGVSFGVSNSELGLVASKTKSKQISTTGTIPLPTCVLSNLSGSNTCSITAYVSSNSVTYSYGYTRVML